MPHNNWFHSRDFVYLCRFIRRLIVQLPSRSTLFDAMMLMRGLRRHFQTVDPEDFPGLALHFLENCGFRDEIDGPNAIDLNANVVESLKESLADNLDENADPTAAHCRYTMIVDPTDCEAAIDLIFSMKLLDFNNTKIVSLSDFPEDATPTRQTAVLAQIKRAIELGECLLLKNSAPLQSALYDVINRHYAISVNADPLNEGKVIREAYANIALGSFSRYVKVHPNFRLVVHVPESKLPVTPLPFLNRMEKYPFSVRNALAQRMQHLALNPPSCLQSVATFDHRMALFNALKTGIEDFVSFAGGSASFYGFAPTEAIPALILRCLDENDVQSAFNFDVKPTVLSLVLEYAHHMNGSENKFDDETIATNEPGYSFSSLSDTNVQVMHRMRSLIRKLNYQVLETARVESVFRLRHRLPATYLMEYLDRQEHLSVTSMMNKILLWASQRPTMDEVLPALKLVIYTRTGMVFKFSF
jgi:E3 ubiquitin-protein ligase RNF213